MMLDFNSLKLCAAMLAQAGPTSFEGGAGDSFFLMLLKTLLVLCFVCGLAYFIFRWLLPRLAVGRISGSMVRVVDVTGIDARKRLYVIEVAGRWLLLASSEAGVQFIAELDAETAQAAALEIERARPSWKEFGETARGTFADRLARIMNRKR
jgi:flagellar protein FliO/FliZ